MADDDDLSGQSLPGPPPAGHETAALLGSLERQRAIFAWKSGGLDAAGLRATLGLIEEYSRHVGHAGLVRASVDGLVGEDPPG